MFADYRHGNFFSGLGHSLLNAVGETPVPPTQPANFVNYNQMQVLVGYGAITKPGFSAAARGNFSLEGRALEYGGVQATYNRNCCGLTVEVQRFALGTVRNETSTTFNLTLSGVAAVGSLVRRGAPLLVSKLPIFDRCRIYGMTPFDSARPRRQ